MSYLVYVPGAHCLPGADPTLRAVGLDMLLSDNRHVIQCRDVLSGGPDGGGGRLLNWFDPQHRDWETPLKLVPSLAWHPAAPLAARGLPAGRYWLGRDALRALRPEMLARPQQYAASPERLLDGHEWLMPIARDLPRNLGLDAEGNLARTVKPAMRGYYEQAERFFAEYLGADAQQQTLTLRGAWEFAVTGLALNYYVNADVVGWLGLLDEAVLFYLVGASFEYRKLLALAAQLQKKTAEPDSPATPATSATSPGHAAD